MIWQWWHYKLNFLKSVIFFNFRGGPVDSTEELPVKIEVHSLSHMMVYLADECLKKRWKSSQLLDSNILLRLELTEKFLSEKCRITVYFRICLKLLWYLVSSHFCHQYLGLLEHLLLLLWAWCSLCSFSLLLPSSSACLAFFSLSYICFPWGTAILAAWPSCGLDTAGMSCVQHGPALAAPHRGRLCY